MNHHSSHPPPASDSGDQRPNDIDLDLALATNSALFSVVIIIVL